MKCLADLAIYIVSEVTKNQIKKPPSDIGIEIARKLKFHSTETATLLMGIWVAQRYGVDSGLSKIVRKTISAEPEYKLIKFLTEPHLK